MTEKWERELEKLRTVGVPSRVRSRVDEGPRRAEGPGPSRGQRVLAGFVAFAFFGAALALAAGAFGSGEVAIDTTQEPIVVRFEVGDDDGETPTATMSFGSATLEGFGGSYCWSAGGSQLCQDFATWYDPDRSIQLPAGRPIVLEGADVEEGSLFNCCGDTEPRLIERLDLDHVFTPEESGTYLLSFYASWPQGSRSFTWFVDVLENEVPQPEGQIALIRLEATRTAPTGSLSFGGFSVPVRIYDYCWDQDGDGQQDACQSPLWAEGWGSEDAYLSIPVGTSYVLDEGGATGIEIRVSKGGGARAVGDPVGIEALASLDDGLHVLSISASWPQGDVEFHFPIDVVAVESPEPPPSVEPVDLPVVSFHGGERPSAVLRFEGREAPSQVESYCWDQPADSDGLVASSCVDTILSPFMAGTQLLIPPGSRLFVETDGREESIELFISAGNDPTVDRSPIAEDGLASLEPGVYVLTAVTRWDGQDERVTFHFGIQVGERASEDGITVPDLVGMDHQEASMLLDELGLEYVWAWREVPDVELGHVASTDPAAGASLREGDPVLLVIATEIEPLRDGGLDALDCRTEERVAFGGPDVRIDPGADAYIRGNLGGIEQTDEVVQVTWPTGFSDWNGLWHVIRDEIVIAIVDWDSLDGFACEGSGIAGA